MKTVKSSVKLTSLFLLVAFFVVLFFPYNAHCGLFGSSVTDYIQFKEGREWKYSRIEKINETIVSRSERHSSSLSPTTLFGKDVIPIKVLNIDNKDYEIYYYFVDSNNFILIGRQAVADTEPKEVNGLILKTPLKINETWESQGLTSTILSLDESVTVPAGTFKNCLKIRRIENIKGKKVEMLNWYAPDIGTVKNIINITTDQTSQSFKENKQTISQLISYKK